jgi:hypothetical protein
MQSKTAQARRLTTVALAAAMSLAVSAVAVSRCEAEAAPQAGSAAPDSATEEQIQALRMEAHASRTELEDQRAEIAELRQELRSQMAILRRAGLVDTAAPAQASNNGIIRVADQPAPPAPPAPAAGAASAARPHSERQADQLLVDVGGVLLPRWTFQVEPALTETHVSNPRVNIFGYTVFNAINIGTIRVDDISQDVIETALSFRLGLPHRMQVDVRLPYDETFVRQTKGIGTGNITELSTRGHHGGDIQATFSWQPITEKGWRPAVVLRTRVGFPTGESVFEIPEIFPKSATPDPDPQLVRAPTGSGYYTIEPGFTLVWRSDPLVLFVGAAYADTLATKPYTVTLTDFNQADPAKQVTLVPHGRIDTGNVYSFNVGMNFAVNERASLNFSFVDLYSKSTAQQPDGSTTWTRIKGTATNDARLGLGASFGLTDNIALVVNAGMGLTDQSPAYTFGLSLPITLPLRHR